MDEDVLTLYDEVYKLYGDVSKLYKLNDNLNDKVIDILKDKTDNFENLKDDIKNVEKRLKNRIDNLSEYCYPIGYHSDNIISLQNKCDTLEKEIESLKAEKENKSSNNYMGFIIAASAFIALFVSAICCGISCSDRVKVEETSTEMRINLDNPQNKDIQLHINHG